MQLHLLAADTFTVSHFQEQLFEQKTLAKDLTFSVVIIQSEEKQRNSKGFLTNVKIILLI